MLISLACKVYHIFMLTLYQIVSAHFSLNSLHTFPGNDKWASGPNDDSGLVKVSVALFLLAWLAQRDSMARLAALRKGKKGGFGPTEMRRGQLGTLALVNSLGLLLL